MPSDTFRFDPLNLLTHMAREMALAIGKDETSGIQASDHRRVYIHRHAKNIAALLHTIPRLKSGIEGFSCRLLVRPAMESQFCLIAACTHSDFVPTKLIAEIVKWKERLDDMKLVKTMDAAGIPALDAEIAGCDKAMADIRTKYGIDPTGKVRKWNTREVADRAGCDDTYVTEYTMLSDQVHGGYLSLEPRTPFARGFLLRSTAFVGLNSLFHYRGFVEPSMKEDCAKQRQFYLNLVTSFEQKQYKEIEWETT